MIKNIVFDIGNVLGHFCWEKVMTEIMGIHGEVFERLADATVRSSAWCELDRGAVSDEEVIEGCIKNAPEQEGLIREFFTHLGEIVVDYDYAKDWIRDLKQQGFGVYLLSNYGKTSYNECRKRGGLAFVEEADGALISYEVCQIKPEREIYDTFLKRFGLKAEECLFFDDRPENVEGARRAGMNAAVFTGYEEAKSELCCHATTSIQ